MHRANTLKLAAVIAVFAGMLAACDTETSPSVATIGGIGGITAINGRERLVISPATVTIATGSIFQLSTNAPPELLLSLEWSSLNGNVATVSPTGTVLGQAAGTARITVRYSDDTLNFAAATITVVGAPSTGNKIP